MLKRGQASGSCIYVFAPYLACIDEQDTIWPKSLPGRCELVCIVLDRTASNWTPAELSGPIIITPDRPRAFERQLRRVPK